MSGTELPGEAALLLEGAPFPIYSGVNHLLWVAWNVCCPLSCHVHSCVSYCVCSCGVGQSFVVWSPGF